MAKRPISDLLDVDDPAWPVEPSAAEDVLFRLQVIASWAFGGGHAELYADSRWPGWEDEVAALGPGQGLSFYPPPWSGEGRGDPAAASRKAVPLTELVALNEDAARQLADLSEEKKRRHGVDKGRHGRADCSRNRGSGVGGRLRSATMS